MLYSLGAVTIFYKLIECIQVLIGKLYTKATCCSLQLIDIDISHIFVGIIISFTLKVIRQYHEDTLTVYRILQLLI